jgi:hypothetical protein
VSSALPTRRSTAGIGFAIICALDVLSAPGYFMLAAFSTDSLGPGDPQPWQTVALEAGAIAGLACPAAALLADRLRAPTRLVFAVALLPLIGAFLLGVVAGRLTR